MDGDNNNARRQTALPTTLLHRDAKRALLGGSLVLIAVGAAVIAIIRQRHSFTHAFSAIGPGAFIASATIAAPGIACTYVAWRSVLHGVGASLPVRVSARLFFVSQLGKYAPGAVWPALMQMEAGRARGIPRRSMLATNLVTLASGCIAGLTVACVTLPLAGSSALHRYWWAYLALPILLAMVHPRVVPYAFDQFFRLIKRPPLNLRISLRATTTATLWSAGSFALFGLHVAVLAHAVGGNGSSLIWLSIGGMALAVSAGVLAVPAPAGAGVRDAILALVLTTSLSGGQALAVVIASRVILIADDTLLAFASVALSRRLYPRQEEDRDPHGDRSRG